ncbi:MAG TPA: transposase [Terriglobia bacterium]|nr:transposase [Terriglobia bacterium]
MPMTFYRRNLPHWHPEGKSIFLTWRLFGSLPRSVQATGRSASARVTKSRAIRATGRSAGATSAGATSAGTTSASTTEWFRRFDAELDKGLVGPVWLRDARIARHVELAIHRGERLGHYKLYAYVVMPNHVHALLAPLVPLARITMGIKGVSARDANVVLGRQGQPFWQDESFDHWIRDDSEFERIRAYIEWNPVAAGLVARPEEWLWSSARK